MCLQCRRQRSQAWVGSLDQEDPLEEDMATHSSILARGIPWTEEHGRLQSIGSKRVRPDWSDLAHMLKSEIQSYLRFFWVFILGGMSPERHSLGGMEISIQMPMYILGGRMVLWLEAHVWGPVFESWLCHFCRYEHWESESEVTQSCPTLSNFTFAFHFHALEKEMATHSIYISICIYRYIYSYSVMSDSLRPHGL